MAERELKTLEARWKDVEHEAGNGKKKVEKMKQMLEACQTRLAGCKWNQLEKQGEAKLRDARNTVKDLTSVRLSYTPRHMLLTLRLQHRDRVNRALGD